MDAVFHSVFARIAIGPLAFIAAFALQQLTRAESATPGNPFFYLAVAASAWFGGRLAGLICAALCAGVTSGLLVANTPLSSALAMAPLWAVSYFSIPVLLDAMDTARRRADSALRERDDRLRLVGEQIPASLWSTDAGLRLTSGFGAGFSTLRGEHRITLAEHFNTTDADFPPIAAHRRALEGVSSSYEMLDRGRTYQCHVEPLRKMAGEIVGVVGVALDITERKHVEDDLKHARDLAEAATHAKDQFLAVLSHELRTPLTPVLAAAHVLATRSELSPDVLSDVDVIRRNVELQARLIDDLLDLTRISNGKLGLTLRPVDLHEVLHNALEVCQEDLGRKHLQLRLELSAQQSHSNADAARLQQVIWNLLKNAVKFTPAGGLVMIRSIDMPGDRIRLEIIDSGIGIDSAALSRIFEPFEQGRSSVTRKYGGLGLGLAISRGLVEAHGGRLMATSEGRNRGATFMVELPSMAPVGAQKKPKQPSLPQLHETHDPILNILLVEDHDDTRRIVARLLREMGHHVRTAGSVMAARAALAEDPTLELLLCDIELPDGSGLELMREARQRPGGIRGIALSGHGMESDHLRSAEAGFARHLVKPLDIDVLERVLREVARPSGAVEPQLPNYCL